MPNKICPECNTAVHVKLSLLFVGDHGVGKKTLVHRFATGAFMDSTEGWDRNFQGISYTNITEILGKSVKLDVLQPDWSSAGNTPPDGGFPYRRRSGIVVVYDITNMSSFGSVSKCLQDIDNYCISEEVVMMLLGNKCDVEDKREVDILRGEQIADAYGLQFFETSGKTGTNLKEAMNAFVCVILKQQGVTNLAVERYQANHLLFEEAMQSGYVSCNLIILLLIGVAGAGKTCFSRLVLDKPPPAIRESTTLAQASIRVVSMSRVAVSTQDSFWQTVSPSELLQMVGAGIKGKTIFHFAVPLPPSPIKPVSRRGPVRRILSKMFRNDTSDREPTPLIKQPVHDPLLAAKSKPSSSELSKSKPVQEVLSHILEGVPQSKERFSENWVYMIDSGGQPQYHELIPTFIHHISGAALFVKLNEDLDSNPTIAYYAKGGELCGDTYSSPLTHRQTIQNCLQTIQSRVNVSGGNDCPALFFVGTHRDLESECLETVDMKNENLITIVKSVGSLKDHVVFHRVARPEKLMYTVNAGKPQPQDRHVAGEFRQAVMSKCKKVIQKTPIGWFILEQQLQQLAQGKSSLVLSLKECLAVAKKLEMDQPRLLAALDYFVRLNLFKYFAEILPNVVFTTSQVLLDKISELVSYSHYLHGGPGNEPPESLQAENDSLRFRDHAIVNATFLQQFKMHYRYGLFTPKELLEVLSNQLVFAPFVGEDFFMPCVLPQLPLEEVATFRLPSGSPVAPMLIHYPGGLFPTGLFSSLVAFLQDRSPWKVAEKHGEPICLFKNCVMFKHTDFPITLTLIYSFEFVEIHVNVQLGFPDPYTNIRTTLFLGLGRAARIQGCGSLHPQFGFLCPCGKNPSHLATISDDKRWWFCSTDDTCNGALGEENLLWLADYFDKPLRADKRRGNAYSSTNEASRSSIATKQVKKHVVDSSSHGSLSDPCVNQPDAFSHGSDRPTMQHLQLLRYRGGRVKVMDEIAHRWPDVAIALEFEHYEIDTIRQSTFLQPFDGCRSMLGQWLEGAKKTPVTWDTLRQALIDAGFLELADQLKTALR